MKSKIKKSAVFLVNSYIFFYILIGLYPVIFLTSKNWFAFETKQLLFLLIIPVVTSLLALLVAGFISLITNITLAEQFFSNENDKIILSVVGFYALYFLLEPAIAKNLFTALIFVVFVFFSTLMVKKIGFQFVNIILLSVTLVATGELVYSLNTKYVRNDILLPSLNKQIDETIRFKKTPNIYLIHLESYHSPAAMKRLYNFDNDDFTDDLNNKGFFVSKNNFSNYNNSLASIGGMFLQQHHYYKFATGVEDSVGIREMMGGIKYNPTLSILKNNGYEIAYMHPSFYCFTGSNYLDYYYPSAKTQDSLSIFQNKQINSINSFFSNIGQRSKENLNEEFYEFLWKKINGEEREEKPTFFYIKEPLEIEHSPANGIYSWKNSEEGWTDTYIERVKNSNTKILETIEKIIQVDPKGILILYGDHGAWKYRNIWTENFDGKDIDELIYERRGLNGEDLALDLFGIFTAIRFPDSDFQILDGQTNINFFRKLFSELSESDTLLKDKADDESYIKYQNKLYTFTKEGKALKKIEIRALTE